MAFENSPDWHASFASWILFRKKSVCSRERRCTAERGIVLGDLRKRGEYWKKR